MTVASTRAGALLALLVIASACESNKSANPLSPSVAGPIPGVEISAPKPLEPGINWEVSNDKQPLALLIENPWTNGQRPVTIDVEVASDEAFATRVFTKAGVTPGPNGRTQLQLPSKLASDRTYFWRAKGQDGANTGPWSTPIRFSIFTPAALQAPTPRSPVDGETVDDLAPSFEFKNAGRVGGVGQVTYIIDIARNDSFTSGVAIWTGGEEGGASGETSVDAAAALPASSTLYWRVKASDGTIQGPWSATQFFKTPAAPAGPGPGGGGGGGGTGGNPGNCASDNGNYIVNCIADKYPEYRRLASARASAARTWCSCATASSKPGFAGASTLAGTSNVADPKSASTSWPSVGAERARPRHRVRLRQHEHRAAACTGAVASSPTTRNTRRTGKFVVDSEPIGAAEMLTTVAARQRARRLLRAGLAHSHLRRRHDLPLRGLPGRPAFPRPCNSAVPMRLSRAPRCHRLTQGSLRLSQVRRNAPDAPVASESARRTRRPASFAAVGPVGRVWSW